MIKTKQNKRKEKAREALALLLPQKYANTHKKVTYMV